jgi:hypothetical protein
VKPQVHISHVTQYLKCGAQREFYETLGPRAPGIGALEGTGTHRTSSKNLSHKKEKGILLSDEEIQDTARDEFNQAWKETLEYSDGPRLEAKEREMGVDKVKGKATDMTIALSLLHHREIAPSIKPDRIEWPWVLTMPDGFDYDLAGTIDLQEAGIPGVSNIMHELKTSARPNIEAHRKQILMYSMALWKLDGAIPPVAVDWLIKKKEPESRVESVEVTIEDFNPLLRTLETVMDGMKKGVYLPTGLGTWICVFRWCGYWPCKYVR